MPYSNSFLSPDFSIMYCILFWTAITTEVNAAAAWLEKGRNWPKVLKCWEETVPLRFKTVFHSSDKFVNAYLQKWPVLSHPSGHELVCTFC